MDPTTDPKLVRIERYYHRLYHQLDPAVLRQDAEGWPGQHDAPVEDQDRCDRSDCRFLDYYSVQGLRNALELYGFLGKIRALGLGEPALSIHRHRDGYDIFRIRCRNASHPVVELVAMVAPLAPETNRFVDAGERRFLQVKWLRMQNAQAVVQPGRPLLPGQDFPGLGLGREMMVLLQLICTRLRLDGVVELPERLHNAVLYFRRFRFLDPEMQGMVTAILRDTRQHALFELAWGVELGRLLDRTTGKALRWIATEQILPRTGPVLAHFESVGYRRRAEEAMHKHGFSLDAGDLARDLTPCGDPGAAAARSSTSFRSKIK